MVKVETNPDTIEKMDISKHHSKIDRVLWKHGYSLITLDLNSEYFHSDVSKSEKVMIKSKWPFLKPTEHTTWQYIAHLAFELSTMSIYLSEILTCVGVGTGATIYTTVDNKCCTVRSDIKEIAERLENEGYNVTIWV
jgi:hypothetical protein